MYGGYPQGLQHGQLLAWQVDLLYWLQVARFCYRYSHQHLRVTYKEKKHHAANTIE